MVAAAKGVNAKPYLLYKVVSAAGEWFEWVFSLHMLMTAVDQNANVQNLYVSPRVMTAAGAQKPTDQYLSAAPWLSTATIATPYIRQVWLAENCSDPCWQVCLALHCYYLKYFVYPERPKLISRTCWALSLQ